MNGIPLIYAANSGKARSALLFHQGLGFPPWGERVCSIFVGTDASQLVICIAEAGDVKGIGKCGQFVIRRAEDSRIGHIALVLALFIALCNSRVNRCCVRIFVRAC